MNRDEKEAVVEQVAAQIQESEAIFAVDYRGLSVPQAAELREQLAQADATLRIVKNRLTLLAADKAGAQTLKPFLEGPTAFTFVRGDAALAAKALDSFGREHEILELKGGTLEGNEISIDEIKAIAKLPARDVLDGRLVGLLASPLTGLVNGLNSLVQGLALQLGQIAEQGLVGGDAPARSDEAPGDEAAASEDAPADETPGDEAPASEDAPADAAPSEDTTPAADADADAGDEQDAAADQASGDEPAETDESDAPSEGEAKEG